jgi:hypothetical protein
VRAEGWLEHGVHALRGALALGLGPWGGAAAVIELYEAAVSSVATAQKDVALAVGVAPARSVLALCADLTRDVGAVQASAARWVLDA